jgi:uncharacterized protein with ATP-grasp and redox domains
LKIALECIPCFVRQAFEAGGLVTSDNELRERILREVLSTLSEKSFDDTPPSIGRDVHGIVKTLTGDKDPYCKAKRDSNTLALKLIPSLRGYIKDSLDPFETALRLAIAGNIIDYGQGDKIDEEKIKNSISQCLNQPIERDSVEDLKKELSRASNILYLADNAGEIVFDRLLIDELKQYPVSLAVRGKPIINDALREDAAIAGIDKLIEVIDNGADIPGTIIEECSQEFRERFFESDLIISKGQGNYETLSNTHKKIFFLLKVKCPVIARDIGCREGDIVLKKKGKLL